MKRYRHRNKAQPELYIDQLNLNTKSMMLDLQAEVMAQRSQKDLQLNNSMLDLNSHTNPPVGFHCLQSLV